MADSGKSLISVNIQLIYYFQVKISFIIRKCIHYSCIVNTIIIIKIIFIFRKMNFDNCLLSKRLNFKKIKTNVTLLSTGDSYLP